jgi:hypothetical protein
MSFQFGKKGKKEGKDEGDVSDFLALKSAIGTNKLDMSMDMSTAITKVNTTSSGKALFADNTAQMSGKTRNNNKMLDATPMEAS